MLPPKIWKRRLENEYRQLKETPLKFEVNKDYTEYVLSLNGPGLYREGERVIERNKHAVKIELNRNYPYPGGIEITWLTPIFHPNIREDGKVCIQLVNDWAENQTVSNVVSALHYLLENPNPSDPLNKEAAAYFEGKTQAPKKPRIVEGL
jgi:ubiquitin-protein ligase